MAMYDLGFRLQMLLLGRCGDSGEGHFVVTREKEKK